jgi:hypothetical protein
MMTVSGVGWIVASQLVARIGDWRELENIRQLGGFLGLVPMEHSTGDKTIGDRSPIPEMGGFEVSSFRPRGRRFEKMASLGNFSARFANAIRARWRPGSPSLQWRANSACGFLWS